MKVLVLSDLHGSLISIDKPFDLLLICGDVCPVWCHSRRFQEEWLNEDFAEWINLLPYKDENSKVVMIAGNHDFYLEGITKKKKKEWLNNVGDRLIYLDNEEYTFIFNDKEYKIFGCPYCRPLPGWAFVRDNLDKYYDYIPNGMDIVMTHDAANFNELGITTEGRNKDKNFGNDILAKYILKTKPKYYFCGHIHTGNHNITKYKGIKVANVSILDEEYNIKYKPLEIDLG